MSGNTMTKFPPRYVLFAGSYPEGDNAKADEEHCIAEAKKYVKRFGLTSEDVKIVKDADNSILVVTKREVELKEQNV